MSATPGPTASVTPTTDSSLVTWTTVVYALHALSIVIGIVGTATVFGTFLFGWPSIIAVILNYVKRGDARGTWIESHFRWQLRTFWFGVVWMCLCVLFVLVTLGLGLLLVWVPVGIVTVWFIYRVIKGWMRLSARRPMYA